MCRWFCVGLWLVGLASRSAWANDPDNAAGAAQRIVELRRSCETRDADACLRLGAYAASDYLVEDNGYHHAPDMAAARWGFEQAIALFDPRCTAGDARACAHIAHIYWTEPLRDDGKELAYLERACASKDADSCQDRGQRIGRSKRAAVRWYVEACRLGDSYACNDLPLRVLGALVLDDDDRAPIDAAQLRAALERTAPSTTRATARYERALALAVAQLWGGDAKRALAALAAATPTLPAGEPELGIFAAYATLVAADGIDRARAQAAWRQLGQLVVKKHDTYADQELESDGAWADPSHLMERAERIAHRNE